VPKGKTNFIRRFVLVKVWLFFLINLILIFRPRQLRNLRRKADVKILLAADGTGPLFPTKYTIQALIKNSFLWRTIFFVESCASVWTEFNLISFVVVYPYENSIVFFQSDQRIYSYVSS
jgi:hypothetical protein